MKFDSVIIGGGLSGLVCGIKLAKAGHRCAIVSSGQSALHFSSGSMDLLNALPDGTAVENPVEAVSKLAQMAPSHPYALIGAQNFAAYADEAVSLLAQSEVSVSGDTHKNQYRLSPIGKLLPTWLVFDGYVSSPDSQKLPYEDVALLNAEGFLDFYTQFVADSLRKSGVKVTVRNFSLSALEAKRNNPTEMRSANIAKVFDDENNLKALAEIISGVEQKTVLIPAFLGFQNRGARVALETLSGKSIFTVATLPPSVPGLQVQNALRRAFENLGGYYMLGDSVVSFEESDGKILRVYTKNHGDVALEADDFVLASGNFFSGGLEAENKGVRETLFGLDVEYLDNRFQWYNDDMFSAQPYESFGVKANSSFQAQKDGKNVENLYVIGAGLCGFNPIHEGCGAGVSMLTAIAAADSIIKK